MMERDTERILIVDDDEIFRDRLVRALGERGFEVLGAESYEKAMSAAELFTPDFAVTDLRMPGQSGLEVVRSLKGKFPEVEILVLTGYGSIASAMEAVRLGAKDYLTKPADADQILAALGLDNNPNEYSEHKEGDAVPSLERVEWEHIQKVMSDQNGNISAAARALGMHRRTLQRKLGKRPVAG